MKLIAAILALLAVIGLIFCWWGLETAAGRRQFDEMAGMIPFFSGVASVVLLIIAAALFYFARR